MALVREAAERDLAGILALYRELNPKDTPLDVDESLIAHFRSILDDESMHLLVVEHEGVPAATCMVAIIKNLTRGARPFAVIENVVTKSEFRRQGFGKMVMERAMDIAKSRGCYKIMLTSNAHRDEAHVFYETLGFDKNRKAAFTLYI